MIDPTESEGNRQRLRQRLRRRLVALHGFLGRPDDWYELRYSFSDIYELETPDLSVVTADGTVESIADRLHAQLLEQSDRSFHLAGYSMGGRIGLAMAVRHPESIASLTLISSTAGLKTEEERAARRMHDELLAQRIMSEDKASFLEFWHSQSVFDSLKSKPALRSELISRKAGYDTQAAAESLRRCGTGAQQSYWWALPSLSIPVLLIAGADDPKYVSIAAEMASLCPHARVAIIKNAGHTVLHEQPSAVAAEMSELLRATETSHLRK